MYNQQNRQAILLFTRTSEQEARSKSWINSTGRGGNKRIAELLINRTRRAAAKTEADIIVYDSGRQRGKTFGERLSNAFQDLFNSGYNQVVAVGNDTPELTEAHLNHALKQLEQGNPVLGPSTDGGVYLIGLTKRMFQAQHFKAIPWETAEVSKALEQWLMKQKISVQWLELLQDIDNEDDLRRFISIHSATAKSTLQQVIRRIISIICSSGSYSLQLSHASYTSIYQDTDSSRAPPAMAA